MGEAPPRPVVAYAPDLMDRSRIAAAVPGVRFVSTPAELLSAPAGALVLVDLARPGVLDVVGDVAGSTVGFASHVDVGLRQAAVAAGCVAVLPRSQFFRRLASGDGFDPT